MNVTAPRIPAAYLQRVLLRGVIFWLLVHAILWMLSVSLKAPIHLRGTAGMVFMAMFVMMIAYSEIAVRRESFFLRNLGLRPIWMAAIPAAIAVSLDVTRALLT